MKKFIKVDGNIGYLMISRKNGYYGVANGPWGWWHGLNASSPYRAKIGGEGLEKEWVGGQRLRRPGEKEEEDKMAAREIEEYLLENDRVPPQRERSRDREEKEEEEEEERAREERRREKKEWEETERGEREKRRKGLSERYSWDWSFLNKK